jgi:hypothetical protein
MSNVPAPPSVPQPAQSAPQPQGKTGLSLGLAGKLIAAVLAITSVWTVVLYLTLFYKTTQYEFEIRFLCACLGTAQCVTMGAFVLAIMSMVVAYQFATQPILSRSERIAGSITNGLTTLGCLATAVVGVVVVFYCVDAMYISLSLTEPYRQTQGVPPPPPPSPSSPDSLPPPPDGTAPPTQTDKTKPSVMVPKKATGKPSTDNINQIDKSKDSSKDAST